MENDSFAVLRDAFGVEEGRNLEVGGREAGRDGFRVVNEASSSLEG